MGKHVLSFLGFSLSSIHQPFQECKPGSNGQWIEYMMNWRQKFLTLNFAIKRICSVFFQHLKHFFAFLILSRKIRNSFTRRWRWKIIFLSALPPQPVRPIPKLISPFATLNDLGIRSHTFFEINFRTNFFGGNFGNLFDNWHFWSIFLLLLFEDWNDWLDLKQTKTFLESHFKGMLGK